MINAAIVGLGDLGNNPVGFYQKNPSARLVVFCDMIQERVGAAIESRETGKVVTLGR